MLHQSSSAGRRKLHIMIMMITIIFNSDVHHVVLIHASAIIAITPYTNLKNQQNAERKAIGD
jgi:hypothetical protein